MLSTQSVSDILDEAKRADQFLAILDQQLQQELDDVVQTASEPERTPHLQSIHAKQKAVIDARESFAFGTLVDLDRSEAVARLQQRVDAINAEVGKVRAHLGDVERYSESVASIADTVAKIASAAAKAGIGIPASFA